MEAVKPVDKAEVKLSVETIMFILYMFYKCNIITRHHLKRLVAIIKDNPPTDMAKYIMEEVGKATT
jgi:hypothetical protein